MPENGDQNTSSSGNSVLIDAVDEAIPIFFFDRELMSEISTILHSGSSSIRISPPSIALFTSVA